MREVVQTDGGASFWDCILPISGWWSFSGHWYLYP
jgi:hypothetical protein